MLSTPKVELENLILYPNPVTNGKTDITLPNNTTNNIEAHIYNLLGKKISLQRLIPRKNTLNISSLNSGIYLVKITQDNKAVHIEKLVVQN